MEECSSSRNLTNLKKIKQIREKKFKRFVFIIKISREATHNSQFTNHNSPFTSHSSQVTHSQFSSLDYFYFQGVQLPHQARQHTTHSGCNFQFLIFNFQLSLMEECSSSRNLTNLKKIKQIREKRFKRFVFILKISREATHNSQFTNHNSPFTSHSSQVTHSQFSSLDYFYFQGVQLPHQARQAYHPFGVQFSIGCYPSIEKLNMNLLRNVLSTTSGLRL